MPEEYDATGYPRGNERDSEPDVDAHSPEVIRAQAKGKIALFAMIVVGALVFFGYVFKPVDDQPVFNELPQQIESVSPEETLQAVCAYVRKSTLPDSSGVSSKNRTLHDIGMGIGLAKAFPDSFSEDDVLQLINSCPS